MLVCRVRICTRLASDSRFGHCVSSWSSACAMAARNQSTCPCGPRRRARASCSCSPRCSRCVMRRSPSAKASMRAASRATTSASIGCGPCDSQRRRQSASACCQRRRWSPSSSSDCSMAASWPKSGVASIARRRRSSPGVESASRSASSCCASSVSYRLPRPGAHGGHAQARERVADRDAFAVAAHEHRAIARFDRAVRIPVATRGVACAREREQIADRARAGARGEIDRFRCGPFAAGSPSPGVPATRSRARRRRRSAGRNRVRGRRVASARTRCPRRGVRRRQARREQGVHRLQHAGRERKLRSSGAASDAVARASRYVCTSPPRKR